MVETQGLGRVASDVVKQVEDSLKVGCTWAMHVLASLASSVELLDRGTGKVIERTDSFDVSKADLTLQLTAFFIRRGAILG